MTRAVFLAGAAGVLAAPALIDLLLGCELRDGGAGGSRSRCWWGSAVALALGRRAGSGNDAQQFIIERRLPVSGGVFPWHRYPLPEQLTRVSLGIGNEAFLCGVFVSLMKLSTRCLAAWREILERIPQAFLRFPLAGEEWHASVSAMAGSASNSTRPGDFHSIQEIGGGIARPIRNS